MGRSCNLTARLQVFADRLSTIFRRSFNRLSSRLSTETGYRVYSSTDLEILQQILFFRELDFPLNDIREIMGNQNYDRESVLQKHKELLLQKCDRIVDR